MSASRNLFWTRTVYHRLDNGKDEYIINALNLPSNWQIEGQTEIPPIAENVTLGIRKSIGNYDVFCLDADDATLMTNRQQIKCGVTAKVIPPGF